MKRLSKYLEVFKVGWSSGFVYRLNFVMWRVRTLVQLLAVYLLWSAVLRHNPSPGGYSTEELLTYILLTGILRAIVFASRSMEVQNDISNGDLSNYLVKPVNYFSYWLSRDWADKVLNILFAVGELTLLYLIFKPPLVLPPTPAHAVIFIVAAFLASIMYFFFSLIISFTVFWIPEGGGWPQRFLIFTMMEFFAGGLFPLDMLPEALYQFTLKLPFAYMGSVPLQIYLGRLSESESLLALFIMMSWIAVLSSGAIWLYRRGLKIYGAYGK